MNEKKRVYPWQRWRRRVIIGCLVCFVVLPGVLAGIVWHNQAAFERDMAAIRAKGFPATPDDLDKYCPTPPKEQNAAEIHEQSFNLQKFEVSRVEYDDIMRQFNDAPEGSPLADSLHKQMLEYLQANAEALRLLHEAAKRPEGRYPLNFSQGNGIALPHLAKLRQSVRLLQIEALVAAEEGDTRRALDAVYAAFTAADSIRQEPILVSQLVRNACHGISLQAVRRMISIAAFSDEELAGLAQTLRAVQDPDALTRALAGERALGITSLEHPELVTGETPAGLERIIRLAAGERGRFLSCMDELISASQNPLWEAIPLMDAVGSRLQSSERSWLTNYTIIGVPPLARSASSFARDAANIAAGETALAIERYRLANGNAVPERLEQLVPDFLTAVPPDPFDGKPLRYRHDDRGYAVYSISQDMRDDGGAPPPRNPKRRLAEQSPGESPPRNPTRRPQDIVFRVDHAPTAAN